MTQRIRSGAVETIIEERTAEAIECRRLAAEAITRWERGEPPDTQAVLASFPEVSRHESVVLDLAYEEYCQRVSAGEAIDKASYCARFPQYESKISRILEVHGYFADRPQALDGLVEPEWPAAGKRFLGFRIREELGRGAIARVYLAEEPALGNRLVALKVSPHGGSEAEMLGKLAHANIVPVFSVQEDESSGLTGICMPYLGRGTLADIVAAVAPTETPPRSADVIRQTLLKRNESLPQVAGADSTPAETFAGPYIDAIVRFGGQLAEALARTHREGILHRDLKPSNVLVTPSGVPMLLDFNLSADAGAHASRVGGTLPYMAPEQIRQVFAAAGHDHSIDARSDIFSLGVIVYELLTGRLPFDVSQDEPATGTMAAGLLDAQERGCPSLAVRNRLIDARLAGVIERCLRFDPEQRPQSAEELARLLRASLRPLPRARRWAIAHPRRAMGLAAAVSSCVLAVALFFALRDPYYVRQYHVGRLLFEQQQYDPALSAFQKAVDDRPDFVEARFALAITRQRIRDFPGAAAEFEAVYEKTKSAGAAAGVAYCRAEQGVHWGAILWYPMAIEGGLSTAVIHNNLGYSLRMQGPPHWDQARIHLNQALKLNPKLQPALFHRAVLALNQSQLDGKPVPIQALRDAQLACGVGPVRARLFEFTAELHILCEDISGSAVAEAIVCLERAVALGLDPQRIRASVIFKDHLLQPRMKELLSREQTDLEPEPIANTLDPLKSEVLSLAVRGT